MPQTLHTIRGHLCSVQVLAFVGGTFVDLEVLSCSSCPSLVGQCFRVCGGDL